MKTSASARVIYPLADGRAILYHSAKKNKPMTMENNSNTQAQLRSNGGGQPATKPTTTRVSLRCQALAEEWFPTVSEEVRRNGQPVFPNVNALASSLNYGFRKGLIDGEQEDHNAAVWIERESAVNYIASYVDAAKESDSGRVRMTGTRPAKPKRDAQRKQQRLLATKDSVDAAFGEAYILMCNDQLFTIGRQPTVAHARQAALKKIGAKLYRPDATGELMEVGA
jgi:hypothetical protein